MANYQGIFVTESYEDNDGKERTSYHRVGVMFPHRNGDGFNIRITSGISVTGELVALPPRAKAEPNGE